jgi:hypothetical protein
LLSFFFQKNQFIYSDSKFCKSLDTGFRLSLVKSDRSTGHSEFPVSSHRLIQVEQKVCSLESFYFSLIKIFCSKTNLFIYLPVKDPAKLLDK